MSDAIFRQIAGGMITLNDSLRAAFLPNGSRCFLLKRSEFSGTRWTVVKELTTGWFIEFSEYRGQFKMLYATLDPNVADEIAQVSFIAFGVPNTSRETDVFSIDPERRDVIPPVGTNAQWKIYVDKAPLERFTIPLTFFGSRASGYFDFEEGDLNPGQGITTGGYDFHFVGDIAPGDIAPGDIPIGRNIYDTLVNVVNAINGFIVPAGSPEIPVKAVTDGLGRVVITYKTIGESGNSSILGTIDTTFITASGAQLSGGSNPS